MPEIGYAGGHSECTGCGEFFNSVYAFDKHQVWTRPDETGNQHVRCMSVRDLVAKGWAKNEGGFWVTSLMPTGVRQASFLALQDEKVDERRAYQGR